MIEKGIKKLHRLVRVTEKKIKELPIEDEVMDADLMKTIKAMAYEDMRPIINALSKQIINE